MEELEEPCWEDEEVEFEEEIVSESDREKRRKRQRDVVRKYKGELEEEYEIERLQSMKSPVRWTAVVVTCRNELAAQAIHNELVLKRDKGELNEDVILLTVDDPPGQVGSGGATLNALLVVSEHISAKQGYSVVNADILSSSLILIIHAGREFILDPCGRAFVTMPVQLRCPPANDCGSLVSNLDLLLMTLSTKLACSTPSGVWICSSDMFFDVAKPVEVSQMQDADLSIICVPAPVLYSKNHGICHIAQNGGLKNIFYRCQSQENINLCKLSTGQVPLVSGVVYVSPRVAESLLGCHTIPPLDSCTYLGVDSGSQSIQLSLFFDFLLSTCTDITEEVFLSGLYSRTTECGEDGSGDDGSAVERNARTILWNRLRPFRAKALLLDGYHRYMNNSPHTHITNLVSPAAYRHTWNFKRHCHSYVLCEPKGDEHSNGCECMSSEVVVNSIVGRNVKIGSSSIVSHCHLETNNQLTISDGCIIYGLHSDDIGTQNLKLNNGIVLQALHVYEAAQNTSQRVMVFYGTRDEHTNKKRFCNKEMTEFLMAAQISVADLWDSTVNDTDKSILNAKLFGTEASLLLLQFLFGDIPRKQELIEKWKNSKRESLQTVWSRVQIDEMFHARRHMYYAVCQKFISDTLLGCKDSGLGWIHRSAAKEYYTKPILEALDRVGAECNSPGIAARTLASIADVLGCMAAGEGGLRSGPACNKQWMEAFSLLEGGCIKEGFEALTRERCNWLHSPAHLVRAARHYEGAAQILIRHAVMSARQFIRTTQINLPALNQWMMAECPARIDLAGGWSDTPPITYEHGGAVVNAAITLNGKKPIGAKARRIERCEIIIHLEGEQKLILSQLSSLQDYNQPHAPGALLKAALLCAEIIKYGENEKDLKTQLNEKYGGGFEISSWSNLPHGSGLGTSSILAGAVMAVLWRCSGQMFDIDSLNHAVLHLEQILTTGGGWQDQVGGLTGGIKVGHSKAEIPVRIEVTFLDLQPNVVREFSDRLILVYTGKTRLARNLLQNVVRNWYARNPQIVETEDALVANSWECAEAFKKGDLEAVGAAMSKYWQQKKIMAPGCEPEAVTRMMSTLEPHLLGCSLAGAGGGGFMYLLTRQPNSEEIVRDILANIPGAECAEVYEAEVVDSGLVLSSAGEQSIEVPFSANT